MKQRGVLDDTMVIWASEFGRTPLGENRGGSDKVTGRDHHPFAFSMWLAGGGIKGGQVIGETDEIGWGVVRDPALHEAAVEKVRALVSAMPPGADGQRLVWREFIDSPILGGDGNKEFLARLESVRPATQD